MSLGYFPKNYRDSVIEFLSAVQKTNKSKQHTTWKVLSQSYENLTTEVTYFPAESQNTNLMILISGVHGSESYTGSALQRAFLDHLMKKVPRNTGVLMIHALNPYGFISHERLTEKHINLNRNCSRSGDIFKIKNSRSVELGQKRLPRETVKSKRSFIVESLVKKENSHFVGDLSLDEFIKIVAPGQFEDPKGFEFGGKGLEPQIEMMKDLFEKLVPEYRNVILLDIHTGLGHEGRLHLLTGDPEKCLSPGLRKQILRVDEDKEIYEFTSDSSEGFYQTFGSTNDFITEFIAPDQEVLALTLEYGTLGHSLENQIESLDRFFLAHQGRWWGYANDELRSEIESKNFEKSHPSSAHWRNQVMTSGMGLFEAVLKRLPQ